MVPSAATKSDIDKATVPNSDQLSELFFHPATHNAASLYKHGFASSQDMTAYEKGRPRYENGGFIISDTPGLTIEEAINERASLHGMPPLGTKLTGIEGIEWRVVNYKFFPMPYAFARYPDSCDFLPIVWPTNISGRLAQFINETNHCTSKQILFIDTMPATHPFQTGQNIHYAICSSNPEESYVFLDIANAHETTFAHEIAHLWLNYVQDGGDGMRRLRDDAWDNAKHIQLNFVQSFVVDLQVNDLIAERGFDMSLITRDLLFGLTLLRDAVATGYRPPTSREALLHSLLIADAIIEQRKWQDEEKLQLSLLQDFFAAATPQIYKISRKLVEIVQRHGYGSRASVRKCLDDCIALAFRFTGDDFDIERDLEDFKSVECMRDKYPQELSGYPVPLKLAIHKALAHDRVQGVLKVSITPSTSGVLPGKQPQRVSLNPRECHMHDAFRNDLAHCNSNSSVAEQSLPQVVSFYMPGVGLSITKTRIAQQQIINSANLYNYAYNNPTMYTDSSGLTPCYNKKDPSIPTIPCPAGIGSTKDALCDGIKRLGVRGIVASGCTTGPKQAQCLVDWCDDNEGNIYCVPDSYSACCGNCAFTKPIVGHQCPDIPSYVCIPTALTLDCDYQVPRCSHEAVTLLHERMHACGSGGTGGNPAPDPAQNRAACLCPKLGL